jgi:hypothetical protein
MDDFRDLRKWGEEFAPTGMVQAKRALELLAERDRLQRQIDNLRSVVKLIISLGTNVPWPEVPESEVDAYLATLDRLKQMRQLPNQEVTGIDECQLNPFSSAACARGTKTCEVKHEQLLNREVTAATLASASTQGYK